LCAIFVIGGCAGVRTAKPIKAGEKVRLEFACRLPGGELAATTDPELSDRPGVARSTIFKKRTGGEPLVVTAGRSEAVYGKPGRRGFEGEIVGRMAEEAVGMKPGEVRSVELAAAVPKDLPPGERFLEMNRVRSRSKEVRMNRGTYRTQTGKEPAEEQSYTIDPSFPGKVTSVSEQEVVIVFPAEPGSTVETPIGRGTVRDAGKVWEIDIDAKVGYLVRSGPMVGRIASVEQRTVTIDYGHPFGGQVLNCDVQLLLIEEANK
jgi:FKBP-type peptidyl-prolyl cis-trans isomerase 2